MNGQSPPASGPADEESLDAAARRLQQEMEIALRHLRERAWEWHALDQRRGPDASRDRPSGHGNDS